MTSTMKSSMPPSDIDDDRAPLMIGIITMCLIIATLMVGARIWTRKVIIDQMGWDDYLAIVTLFIIYGEGIAMGINTRFGLGKHVGTFDPALIRLYFRTFYVSINLYTSALLFVKMTFLFQYYRVFSVQHMRKVYIIAILIVGSWGISQIFVGIFICTPIAGFWDTGIKSRCIPQTTQWYVNGAGNIATDVAVFLLPIPVIRKLQLPKQQKILVLGIFSLGFFTVAISVIRIKFLKLFEDFSWENVESSCWSIAEITSALTCACLPTLRPMLTHYFPKAFPTLTGHRANYIQQKEGPGFTSTLNRRTGVSHTQIPVDTFASTGSRDSLNRKYELESYEHCEMGPQNGENFDESVLSIYHTHPLQPLERLTHHQR